EAPRRLACQSSPNRLLNRVGDRPVFRPSRGLVALPLCRAPDLAAFLPRAVLLVALPPIARLLSRRPCAPTCDLPSRSCWYVSPRASLRSILIRFRLFFRLLSYLEAPASF